MEQTKEEYGWVDRRMNMTPIDERKRAEYEYVRSQAEAGVLFKLKSGGYGISVSRNVSVGDPVLVSVKGVDGKLEEEIMTVTRVLVRTPERALVQVVGETGEDW